MMMRRIVILAVALLLAAALVQEVSARRHSGGHKRSEWLQNAADSQPLPQQLQQQQQVQFMPMRTPPVTPLPPPTLEPPPVLVPPEPRPDLPDETGFGQDQPHWTPQDPNTRTLPPSVVPPPTNDDDDTPAITPLHLQASIGDTSDIEAADAKVAAAAADAETDPVDTSNPAPHPPPLKRHGGHPRLNPSPRLHAIRPPHWKRPEPEPEQPTWRTHPVGPEVPPSTPSGDEPQMGEGGEKLPPTWTPDVSASNAETTVNFPHRFVESSDASEQQPEASPSADESRGLFQRFVHRLRQISGRIGRHHPEHRHHGEESVPTPVDASLASPPADSVAMLRGLADKFKAATAGPSDSSSPSVTPSAPAEQGYESDDEKSTTVAPTDEDKSQKDGKDGKGRHHGGGGGGRHHGGNGGNKDHHGKDDNGSNSNSEEADKAAKKAARVAAKHDAKLRKAFLKLRSAVTSPSDLLHLRLEVHRLESQMGVASELQNAGQLAAVPAYGGPAITDASYQPIGNSASWNDQLSDADDAEEEEKSKDQEGGRRHGHHHGGSRKKHIVFAVVGSVVGLIVLVAIVRAVKRKRAQKRRCQEMHLNSILPSYAPATAAAAGAPQAPAQQQGYNVPVAEAVYPAYPHFPPSQLQQHGYSQLASAPANVRVQ